MPEGSTESRIICAETDLPYVSGATAVCQLQRANLQSTFQRLRTDPCFIRVRFSPREYASTSKAFGLPDPCSIYANNVALH